MAGSAPRGEQAKKAQLKLVIPIRKQSKAPKDQTPFSALPLRTVIYLETTPDGAGQSPPEFHDIVAVSGAGQATQHANCSDNDPSGGRREVIVAG
jgi:hypothetical protein